MAVVALVSTAATTPLSAAATVTGWQVDWCAPIACNPTQTYAQGMPMTTFKTNANKSNCSGFQPSQTQVDITNRNGGYLNAPDGLFAASYTDNVTARWTVGEPVWCSNLNVVTIPLRYFAFNGGQNWNSTPGSYNFSFIAGERLSITCLGSTGTQNTWLSNASSAVKTGASGTGNVNGVTYDAPNASMINASFNISTQTGQVNGTGGTTIQGITFFNNTGSTGCSTILNITMTVATDTIGGFKTVQWAGARAMNGSPNTWSLDDITNLNCNIQNPPKECVGVPTTPYLIACGKVDLLAIDWTALVECVFGTPEDFQRGIQFLDDELDLPLPQTASCSPWSPGTVMGANLVIDICGWYPTVRPMLDILMTAGLWIALIASVFRLKNGAGD